jgi:hypothetical protein
MDKQLRVFTDEETEGTFLAFNREEWAAEGKELGRAKDRDKWEIGEWLIRGEVRGRMAQKELQKEATKATGLPWGSLKNCKWIAGTFEKSRRRDELSYEHHAIVAAFDEKTQDELLERAVKGDPRKKSHEPWSTGELKKAIKRMREHGTLPKLNKKPKLENTTGTDADQKVVIEGKVNRKIHDFLRELAAARGVKTPEALIWEMAIAYFRENKDKLQAEVDQYRAKSEAAFIESSVRDAPMEEEVDAMHDEYFAQKEKSEA